MVPRLDILPCLMGCDDGPVDLLEPPDINATPPIHGDIFRVDRVNLVFQSRSKYIAEHFPAIPLMSSHL